jgi:predicted secreted protein
MRKRLHLTAIVVALCALTTCALCGCAGNQQQSSSSDSEADVISVALDYSAGTGYEWQCTLSGDEDALTVVKETDEDLAKDENIDGGPLQHQVTMKAAHPGTTVLTCELVRPWEKDVEPAETQVYNFTVDDNLQITFNAGKSTYTNDPVFSNYV